MNILSCPFRCSPAPHDDPDSWSDLHRQFLTLEENWLLPPSEVMARHHQFSGSGRKKKSIFDYHLLWAGGALLYPWRYGAPCWAPVNTLP